MEDKELLALYKSTKDQKYIAELYAQYMQLVFGSCLKYFKNADDAQDAAMDIYEKIVKKTLTSDVTYFKSWLYTVTRNHCLEVLRRRNSRSDKESEAEFMYTESVFHPDSINNETEVNLLHECLNALQSAQKNCVDSFYFKKLSYSEIADQFQLSIGQVRSRIQNGRRNLKICLEGKIKLLNQES